MSVPPQSAAEAAALYISKGWQVVPLAPKEKAPTLDGWTRLRFTPDDFGPNDNIGIRSIDGIVDIDCDAPEVVSMAAAFLPPTGAVYGRKSKPAAHWLYRSDFDKTIAYKDLHSPKDKATLVEIRVNHQSMAPPSVHPGGERIEWRGTIGDPATIDPEELQRAVRLLATSALVARHYNPPGNRHDWGLALAGAFQQLGLTEAEALKVMEQAGKWVRDHDVKDRLAAVRSTYGRGDDDPITSTRTLKELMANGQAFVKSLHRIWGAGSSVFILDAKGERIIANNQENIKRALEKLGVTLSYDVFSQRALVRYGKYHGALQDAIRNRIWLEIDRKFHFRPSSEFFDVVLQDTAYHNSFHPVCDYLDGLKWDGQPRIDEWLIRYGGAADTPYVRAVSALVLIAAVRRVRRPGCKFDELLVLESEQGLLKSSALRALCPVEEWFSDDLPLNVDAKQIIERTAGKWIIEAAELTGLGRRESDHLKAMLSRQVDGPVRLAYARLPVEQPRQFIVIGTTNSHVYLKDITGNRRFWPVRVKRFDVDAIIRDRDQLWAEAAHRDAKGESIRLRPELFAHATLQQERRRVEDPWEQKISEQLDPNEPHRLTPDDVWQLVHVSVDRRTERDHQRLIEIMQRLGFRRASVRKDKKVVKGWVRDAITGNMALKYGGDDDK